MFPESAWIEPLVLLGLGIAFLYVSARTSVRERRSRGALTPKQAAA